MTAMMCDHPCACTSLRVQMAMPGWPGLSAGRSLGGAAGPRLTGSVQAPRRDGRRWVAA